MFRFERFELITDTFELLADGVPVPVEPQVFGVLVYLIEHRDRVVPKEELLDEVWGNRFVSESALTSRIKSARRAVDDDGRAQRLIRNSHGRGYQFVGDVTADDAASTVLPADDRPEGQTDARPTSRGAIDTRSRGAIDTRSSGAIDTWPELSLLVDEEFRFVGREDLLLSAASHVDRVQTGENGALLLGGEPGLGKTRLAAEIARRAQTRDGVQALAGRCDRHLSSSLQPWLEALGTYVAAVSDEVLAADTAGIGEHLRFVFPTLQARLGPTEHATAVVVDEYAVLDAIVVLIERICNRTSLVIVLDDVQWAGGATRALASLLLRRGVARVLLVLTFRTTIDDLDETTREWLSDIASHGSVERIDLVGLGSDDIDELISGLDIDDEVRAQVWELSEGHTLFATELLRDVRRGIGLPHLPETVAALIRSRLEHLPPDVTALVSASAAVGPDFGLKVVGEAAGLTPDQALEAVELAMEAELVHEVSGSSDRFRFSHQLVPAAITENMSSARLVRLHARLVEVIEANGGPATAVAHHLLEAFPVLDGPQVIERVRATAATALIEHQYDAAAELLARCAELPVDARIRAEVLTELGRAYNAAGRQPEALAPFEKTADSARRNGWPDLLIAAAIGRWGASPFRASQDRTVIPLLDEALAVVADDDHVFRAQLLAKRAAFTLFTAPLDERDERSGLAESLVGPASTRDRLAVLEARWMAIACPATVFQIEPLDVELERLRKELGVLTTDACAPEIGLYWRGQGDALWELADDLDADPRQRRDVDQWRTTTLAGTEALFDGRFDEARALTDAALPLGREPWGESGRVVHALVLLLIDVLDGTEADSRQRWFNIAETVPSDNMRATRAWVEAITGDQDEARDLLDQIAPRVDRMRENFMGGFGLVAFAEAVLALAHDDHVPMLREVLAPMNDRMLGHPWAPSFAAPDLLCRLDRRAGDGVAAETSRAQALDLYQRLGAKTMADRLGTAFDT